ncbi:MAG TPA: sensor domain-containing diguanylate cyclase [Nitrospirae bacterium]|nr:response regulator PleD [bacterium BMS3Abin06]HDH10930.1 sensor domain-containing diguanylate cyclase [Nitrospirota bacterium]HDZ00424.1 sensor domain-containing diguanylate cyclase [Nitrospirota bacterium]
MIFNQIFDAINIGLVIIDRDLKVHKWNRWMEVQSGIDAGEITGTHIFETFPGLNTPKFLRSCKSVFSFGNFCFFSQKLHHYLFPFKSTSIFDSKFEYMQQNCAMGPLRDENNVIRHLFIYVQDVTEVAVYEQKLLDLNMKDDLTGAYNRRFLEMKLNEEVNRYRRYRRDFSIIMFDIDYFKGINDRYGHQCGDFILKSVSSRISSKIRNVDYLARYGGDEFCCLLPETDIDSALIVAERFRTAIMEQENNFDGSILKITISLGVSELREGLDTPEILLKKADGALYKAKNEGRNRVVAIT